MNAKYRPLIMTLALSLILVLGAAQTFAAQGGGFTAPAPAGGTVGTGGGYSGPGPALVTVEQAKAMNDDARVTLRGNIIQSLGGKRYVFKDATGTIDVEISDKRWQGQNVGPDDLVEISGEVDKDWGKAKVEAKRVARR